jgi:hypothetical protein
VGVPVRLLRWLERHDRALTRAAWLLAVLGCLYLAGRVAVGP